MRAAGGVRALLRSLRMLLFLGHFLKTGVFSFIPPRVNPQSTSGAGRFVHVFGRRLAPEAMPQPDERASASTRRKSLRCRPRPRSSCCVLALLLELYHKRRWMREAVSACIQDVLAAATPRLALELLLPQLAALQHMVAAASECRSLPHESR